MGSESRPDNPVQPLEGITPRAAINGPAVVDDVPLEIQRTRKLFRIYAYYRIVTALTLIGVFFLDQQFSTQPYLNSRLYLLLSISYFCISVFLTLMAVTRFRPNQHHITLAISTDITLLILLMAAGNGLPGGQGNLILISVAAGNILSPQRTGYLFASIGSLGILCTELWLYLEGYHSSELLSQSGWFGLALFVTAIVIRHLARRILQTESVAETQAQAIRRLQQLNQQIIQQMQAGIMVTDLTGQVELNNSATGGWMDLPPSPEGAKLCPEAIRAHLSRWRHHAHIPPLFLEPPAIRKPVRMSFHPLGTDTGERFLILLEDSGEITQQAQQLKLRSLSKLAGSIAHEIRNPLSSVTHAAQLLAESELLDSSDRELTEIIIKQSGRINAIVESVLQLSRRQPTDQRTLDLNQQIVEFIHGEKRRLPEEAIETELADGPIPILFDPVQLHQLLHNLVENGYRYSRKTMSKPRVWLRTGWLKPGQQPFIQIIDRGPGIPKEALKHLFEPFFTTEKMGTGLGLYLSREIAEANQAILQHVPVTTLGTCFQLTFSQPQSNSPEPDNSP